MNFASQSPEYATSAPEATPAMPVGLAKIVVAIHGIGDQYRNATVQSVVNIFSRCFEQAVAVPLGGFYAPDGRMEAFQLRSPPDVSPQMEDIGFVEVYWADIPRRVQRRGYTIEETKAWARTVVQRVRARYSEDLVDHTRGQGRPLLQPRDYLSAAATIEEMIDAIRVMGNLLFLAEKAGLYKFDLDELLTSFVGDVQIVAEFANYRERILRQFRRILAEIHKLNPGAAIYVVAHSEGTVVALLALLQALSIRSPGTASPEGEEQRSWVRNVRGLMTIGSPIDKHIALWPDMWDPVQEPDTNWLPRKEERIAWRNYYDYGDPVGFELDTVRAWLKRHDWDEFFEFGPSHDFGFARYFVPAKAHNDYWNDPSVFGHFICDVMNLAPVVDGKSMKKPAPRPPDRRFAKISSYITPFIFIVATLSTGVYLLFAALNSYLGIPEPWYLVVRDVAGVTCLLGGMTTCSRILCLTRRLAFKLTAIVAFLLGAVSYVILRTDWVVNWPSVNVTRHGFLADTNTVVIALLLAVFAVVFSVIADRSKQFLQRYPPFRLIARGARPLLVAGALAAAMLMIHRAVAAHQSFLTSKPFWPVVVSAAAFLYLWWLAIILFDLTFVWQRYIRQAVGQKYLSRAREHLIARREMASG
jgi:hypothetical protein